MTVGASTILDAKASFSNWGGCLDLYAPGENISVATIPTGYTTANGTSFAAPFVAGVAAALLQRFPGDSPDQVHAQIVGGGTQYALSGVGLVPENVLLYSVIPSTPEASISGPSTVGLYNASCQWTAVVRGGRPPYSYQWSGIASGSYAAVTGPVSGSGTLYLNVWDNLGQASTQAAKYVYVDPNNPGGLLCN